MTLLKQRMLEDLRIRNYAPTTVECYVRSVADFARHFDRSPDQLGPEDIRAWQLHLLNEKHVKVSTYIQAVCGLRFFYRKTLNQPIDIERIPLPRYEKKLPVILSKEEVNALLTAPTNLGHRAIMATMYGAGLRVSEVTNLKVQDLDRARKVIRVARGDTTGIYSWTDTVYEPCACSPLGKIQKVSQPYLPNGTLSGRRHPLQFSPDTWFTVSGGRTEGPRVS